MKRNAETGRKRRKTGRIFEEGLAQGRQVAKAAEWQKG
jgi:hypothetical protein